MNFDRVGKKDRSPQGTDSPANFSKISTVESLEQRRLVKKRKLASQSIVKKASTLGW